MKKMTMGMLLGAVCALLALPAAFAANFPAPLAAERVPSVLSLPAHYPQSWTFLNYASDRIELRDVGGDARAVMGQLQARDSATLLVGTKRPEVYVADTVWSRGGHGTRTDFITIYDAQTFKVVGEIVLPGGKRALITPMQGMFAFTDDERLALVFDFTPASSVTVVDLVNRKVLGDIDIPGCSLIYPTGKRGFSTLCASGSLLTIRLDANGAVAGRSETKPFNALDQDPLFTVSAGVAGVQYFPTLQGRVQPISLKGEDPAVLPAWPLVPAADAAGGWRPSGWQLIASDESKLLYVLMQPESHEGTHKDPAAEVWVYDASSHARLRRLRLVRPGSSLALSHGAQPLLLVQAAERLDVYDPATGGLVRSLALPGFRTRMSIDPVR
jgi:methylamine dehydrogenase heavy chain